VQRPYLWHRQVADAKAVSNLERMNPSDLSSSSVQQTERLSVEHFNVTYRSGRTAFQAVNDVTVTVEPGSSLCIVGSSGAGKSSILSSILGLLPNSAETTGHVRLPDGPEHHGKDSSELLSYRRSSIGTVFQDPVASLMPGVPVLRQVASAFRIRHGSSRTESVAMAKDALARAGLARTKTLYGAVPGELSGGMCQRVAVALALSAPKLRLILADEPTSNLDSVRGAQILDLLFEVQAQHRATFMLITHDIRLCRRFNAVGVVSGGRLVELSSATQFGESAVSEEGKKLLAASRRLS
jgi:ABC-type glutathione transport system ATPase component